MGPRLLVYLPGWILSTRGFGVRSAPRRMLKIRHDFLVPPCPVGTSTPFLALSHSSLRGCFGASVDAVPFSSPIPARHCAGGLVPGVFEGRARQQEGCLPSGLGSGWCPLPARVPAVQLSGHALGTETQVLSTPHPLFCAVFKGRRVPPCPTLNSVLTVSGTRVRFCIKTGRSGFLYKTKPFEFELESHLTADEGEIRLPPAATALGRYPVVTDREGLVLPGFGGAGQSLPNPDSSCPFCPFMKMRYFFLTLALVSQ